jgi:hypothetical protein
LKWFSKKTYTLVGFEPGSSVSEADAMSTAPRRQGICKNLKILLIQQRLRFMDKVLILKQGITSLSPKHM